MTPDRDTGDRSEPRARAQPWILGVGSGLTAGGIAGAATASGPRVTVELGTPVQYGLLVLLCAVSFVVITCGFVVLARARRLFTESWVVRHDVGREDLALEPEHRTIGHPRGATGRAA